MTYKLKSTIGMPKKTDPSLWQSPAFSIRSKCQEFNNFKSPGPIYKLNNVTRYGLERIKPISIAKKYYPRDVQKSPGPAAYFPCYPNLKRAPTPIFLFHYRESKKDKVPPPNSYNLQKHTKQMSIQSRTEGFTIKSRTKYGVKDKGIEGPGPAAYNAVNLDKYKEYNPPKTMGKHLNFLLLDNIHMTPGPGSYNVSKCFKCCQKNFTFGKKRPSKFVPYVVPEDNNI
ncbi:outer dense fiber protein 3-like [Daktulosphaira vitifoliae]|uniref:outer dense fiber protein 3-like n=1 Tax=Daktulosphaira vitifoliae TaxID=58002 RepID=UPI0021A9A704|nr:outer dense fiber protein 3-like [Daktulosphaira vitifoliae]